MSLQQQLSAALVKDGIQIRGPVTKEYASILTPDALRFVASIHNRFEDTRRQLLENRQKVQLDLSAGRFPDFPAETKQIRESEWKVAPIPKDLTDRRVEITGPVTRKMIINALNSGAKVFMADFEDSNSPTWTNNVEGQINLRDAANGNISFTGPDGKKYSVGSNPATLMVRPRGWHLVENHMLVKGQPVAGAFFDFGLFFPQRKDASQQRIWPVLLRAKDGALLRGQTVGLCLSIFREISGCPRGKHSCDRPDRDYSCLLPNGRVPV